jgi:hypothetical protein
VLGFGRGPQLRAVAGLPLGALVSYKRTDFIRDLFDDLDARIAFVQQLDRDVRRISTATRESSLESGKLFGQLCVTMLGR